MNIENHIHARNFTDNKTWKIILDLQHPNEPTRCQSCQKRERCSGYLKLETGNSFKMQAVAFNPCQSCHDRHIDRIRNQRTLRRVHRLVGILRASCLACLGEKT